MPGNVRTVVLLHGSAGYDLETVSLTGKTLAVVSLATHQERPLAEREIA